MSIFEITDINEAPKHIINCQRRVTQELINCRVRIVSRQNMTESKESPRNRYESEAKRYYQSLGYTVIRLEHFTSASVKHQEDCYPESKILGRQLRKYLSKSDYDTYTYRNPLLEEAISLDTIDPKDYSISFYPPDFLMINKESGKHMFVEVKGPSDKLRFRQANWFVNLLPESWEYEIFASINKKFDETYVYTPNTTKGCPKFYEEYEKEIVEVNKWREFVKVSDAKRKILDGR